MRICFSLFFICFAFFTASCESINDQSPTATAEATSTADANSLPPFNPDELQPGQMPYSFISSSGEEVRYLLYIPKTYDAAGEWPLLIFLHGAGGNGKNIKKLYNVALPAYLEETPDVPFIAVSPQLESGNWSKKLEALNELTDYLIQELPIDKNRLFLTGSSRGGYGAWTYALKSPDRFAALAVVAAGASLSSYDSAPENICDLKNMPIWVFVGEEDTLVPIEWARKPVDALEVCGGNAQLTTIPGADHGGSIFWVYENPDLYKWFLEH